MLASCVNLPFVYLDAVFTDVIAEKLGGGLMEGAFLGFEVELVFAQALEDCNMLTMFSQAPGVDQDIINVDNHKAVKELPEHLVYTEYGGCVDQTIWHDEVFVLSSRSYEGGLPLVPLTYPEDVICAAKFQLSEHGCSTKSFQAAGMGGRGYLNLTVLLLSAL